MSPEHVVTSIVVFAIIFVLGAEHVVVSALHAAARIRDTKRQLFPPKKPTATIGPRIVENGDEDRKTATR
jgi:hypothetical protein